MPRALDGRPVFVVRWEGRATGELDAEFWRGWWWSSVCCEELSASAGSMTGSRTRWSIVVFVGGR